MWSIQWFSRISPQRAVVPRLLALAGLALLAACGGGGDTPTTPTPPGGGGGTTPPNTTVTSVAVSPNSVALTVPGTVQLTATARNSAGAELSGQTFSWTSSAAAVATVTQSGVVTAVAAGTTTITASAAGQSGTAQITVTASPFGPVLDRKAIGPAGGTLSGTDVAVTIPAGALSGTSTIELVRDTILPADEGSPRSGDRYFIEGLPAGQAVQARVRLRAGAANTGVAAIAARRPVLAFAERDTVILGTDYQPATDSAGWYVATVRLEGRNASAASGGAVSRMSGLVAAANAPADWGANPIDGFINLVLNMATETTPNTRFRVWGSKSTDPAMEDKVKKVAGLLESSWNILTGTMGYTFAHRASWPLQVEVAPIPGNGVFKNWAPHPWNADLSSIGYNNLRVPHVEFPGTVIHEVYHFLQQGYLAPKTLDQYAASMWLMEATATWMAGKHTSLPNPYINETALSWKDSLYSGVVSGMGAKSGYGKAPLMKYLANRFGDAKVKEIWASVQGGADPITAVVGAVPEAPSLWWPQVINQQWGGSLYPWTPAQLMPDYQKYGLTLLPGRREYLSDALKPLGVETDLMERDTAMFGPNFRLPVYLDPVSMGKGRILVLEKPAAATHFRPIVGTDTVFIPGNRLRTVDTVAMLLTRTELVAPYNTTRKLQYYVDLRLPNGDWFMPTVTNVNDNIRFACDTGVTVSMDPADNVTSVWSFLANAGTWTRKDNPAVPATYEWAVDPAMADSLSLLGITLSSTLRESAKDTVYAQARLRWAPAAGSVSRFTKSGTSGAAWWWWLVPIGLVPVAVSKKTRRALPAIGAAVLLFVVGCVGIGAINWTIDETFDFSFTKMRWTADPNDANATLMELNNGVGKTTMNQYLLQYWRYIYDANDVKVDSVRGQCTGTGAATYSVSGVAYNNGVKPPETGASSELTGILERSMRVQGARIKVRQR